MYRIYKILADEKGTVVHKIPIAMCISLKTAMSHARVWSNGWTTGIYEIKPDGSELRVTDQPTRPEVTRAERR